MAAKRKTRKAKRRDWSAGEVKQLRVLAGLKPLAQIARALNRTAMATRRKATQKRISLAMKRG